MAKDAADQAAADAEIHRKCEARRAAIEQRFKADGWTDVVE